MISWYVFLVGFRSLVEEESTYWALVNLLNLQKELMDIHQLDTSKMLLFSTWNLCSSNLDTSRGLISFSSIKQVTPLASFSSSGFHVPVTERAHLLFLRGKIVALLLHSLLILWSHMKHSGGGLLCRVLLCGSTVTRSSLEVLLEEASPAFVLGACSHGLSLMVTNLSLAFSETMSEQTVGWLGPTMGRRSFTWHGIPSTIMFCALLIPVICPTYIFWYIVHVESLPTLGHPVWRQPAVDCVSASMFHWFLLAVCCTDRPYWLVL